MIRAAFRSFSVAVRHGAGSDRVPLTTLLDARSLRGVQQEPCAGLTLIAPARLMPDDRGTPVNGPGHPQGRGGLPANRKNALHAVYDGSGEMCGWRHMVDSFLPRTGEFRAVATRYDRTAARFAAGIHPVAGVVAAS